MSAIIAVMLVVACEPDLIHCSDVVTWQQVWPTVESCKVDEDLVVNVMKESHGSEITIMTKCRLFVDEGYEFQKALLKRKVS